VKLSAKSQVNGRVTATRFVSQRDDQSPAETNGNAGANGNAVTARLTERRTVTLCEYCGRDISHRRADAKFCNRICKQAKYRLDRKLPSDVASLLALITVGEPHGRWSVGPPHGEGIAG
jgi:hypothetical protein